jgi:hypothetical protein
LRTFRETSRAVLLAWAWVLVPTPGGTQPVTDHGPVRSNLDIFGWSAVRDCGFSEPLVTNPGSSLWIFCDSHITRPDGSSYDLTSTAAQGPDTPGTAPGGLVELGPFGVPTQFLAAATGISCPGGYTPNWASGAILLPFTTRMLIPYVSFCVSDSAGWGAKRYGVAEWDAGSRSFSHNAPSVFANNAGLEAQRRLRTPVHFAGHWYFFGQECTRASFGACEEGRVFVARVSVGANAGANRPWADPSRYRWLTPAGWTRLWNEARSVIPDATPVGVAVDWYPALGRYVLVEQTSLAGHVRIWTATNPAGPWDLRISGQVPCAPGPPDSLCRALIGHPELSTPSEIALSFFQPSDGRVHVVTLPY